MNRVIIDTDPGIDDAHSILMALCSDELQIEGFTTVFGNSEVESCTRNLHHMLSLAGQKQPPVFQGSAAPLIFDGWKAPRRVHGEQGLANVKLPPVDKAHSKRGAVRWLVDTVMNSPGEIDVLALGPLTNIVLATLVEPEWRKCVKRVIFMGGIISGPGNVLPLSTANIYNDAEAAKIVFHAGYPVVMVGQDVTRKAPLTPKHRQRLRKLTL